MRRPPYRTLAGVLLLGAMMLIALWLTPSEARAGVATPVVSALSTLGLWLAGKAAVEHSLGKPPP